MSRLFCQMWRYIIFSLIFLIGCAPNSSVEPIPSESIIVSVPDEVQAAAAIYRELRPIAGQFNGGEWHPEADDWHGAKHTAMIKVAAFADDNEILETTLIELLGVPDLSVRENDKLLNLVKLQPDYEDTQAESSVHLIYYWRGEHDFLFFEIDNGAVVQSGWWYSME